MSKIPLVLISIILIFSCGENKHNKEIRASIKQLNQDISIRSHAIEDRGAQINNISQLSDSFKVKYKYDSLLDMQKLEIAEIEKLKIKKDSLDNELKK